MHWRQFLPLFNYASNKHKPDEEGKMPLPIMGLLVFALLGDLLLYLLLLILICIGLLFAIPVVLIVIILAIVVLFVLGILIIVGSIILSILCIPCLPILIPLSCCCECFAALAA